MPNFLFCSCVPWRFCSTLPSLCRTHSAHALTFSVCTCFVLTGRITLLLFSFVSCFFVFEFVLFQQCFLYLFICVGWSLCVILLGSFAYRFVLLLCALAFLIYSTESVSHAHAHAITFLSLHLFCAYWPPLDAFVSVFPRLHS